MREGGWGGGRARARALPAAAAAARTASKVIICAHDERFWLMTKAPMHMSRWPTETPYTHMSHDDVHGLPP